jgi:hypothetical protein
MYGKRSTTKSKNGYFTKTGPGLRQQMQDGHIQYYNGVLTERFLQDYLMDIFFARVNEGDRNITCMTGTGGAILFHDLLAASASSFLQIDTNFVQKVPSNSQDVNHLAYGAQFTKYIGPEGICVTLIKNPMYDDKFYCPEMSPFKANMPIDSFRFTFLDFGKNKDMENNIEFVSVEDTYRWGYVSGTVTPTGPVKGGSATSLTAGITYFMEGSAGVWMKDVSRCGELILDVA